MINPLHESPCGTFFFAHGLAPRVSPIGLNPSSDWLRSRRPTLNLAGYARASDNAILQRVLALKRAIYVPDTREERLARPQGVSRWIAVPLVLSDSILGLLSIGSKQPRAFSTRHFHLAKLLGIPAAVAIHNARLYEWAQIYARRAADLVEEARRNGG
jgi:GAF domain-containing protein